MAAPASIPLSQLSMLIEPPERWLMAALKAYLDDAGSANLRAIAIGGYVGDLRSWKRVEPAWQIALDWHGVPYFHFNEICDPNSPMHKFYGRDGAAAQSA